VVHSETVIIDCLLSHSTTVEISCLPSSDSVIKLADVYAALGKFEASVSLFQSCLRSILGSDHPLTMATINGLTFLL
jgi:hypothetical protein